MIHIVTRLEKCHMRKIYRVIGDMVHGYGIKIIWIDSHGTVCYAETPCIFPERHKLTLWVHEMAQARVHPCHLADVVRDHMIEKLSAITVCTE